MQFKLLSDTDNLRIFVVVLDAEEEAMSTITEFVRSHEITAASISGIGAFSKTTLGFFDLHRQEYEHTEIVEQCEVLSLLGDCALDEKGVPGLHLHTVLGTRSCDAKGGHLLRAIVRPTLEVIISETSATMRRKFRPEFGIPLLDPNK